jgi:hypothetical protein
MVRRPRWRDFQRVKKSFAKFLADMKTLDAEHGVSREARAALRADVSASQT